MYFKARKSRKGWWSVFNVRVKHTTFTHTGVHVHFESISVIKCHKYFPNHVFLKLNFGHIFLLMIPGSKWWCRSYSCYVRGFLVHQGRLMALGHNTKGYHHACQGIMGHMPKRWYCMGGAGMRVGCVFNVSPHEGSTCLTTQRHTTFLNTDAHIILYFYLYSYFRFYFWTLHSCFLSFFIAGPIVVSFPRWKRKQLVCNI